MFEDRMLDADGIRCHVVIDGWRSVSPRFVFKDYDDEIHGPYVRPFLDAEGKLPGRFACLLVEAPDGPVLVDAGVGAFAGDLDAGHLLERLADLDIRPWDIRDVVITHAHADHVGGLVTPRGDPVFADARHTIHQREAAFWTSSEAESLPGDAGAPARAAIATLLDADLLRTVDGHDRIGDRVQVVDAPGHTPGHVAVVVNGAVLWAGDAIISPLNATHPDWVSAADMDAAMNGRTRRALFGRAADQALVVAGSHLPVVGRVVRIEDAFRLDELRPA
jgi:glyoxylase-like metal-dependent hydrolase (beta-lactamase superfamily II)